MVANKHKEKNMATPIEKHETAAWANIESVKKDSRVPLPSTFEVENAKEWVDKNQK
ncbi:CDIF630_02480 family spore surface protein [Paramaledivibacter caminithermalis]|uniref:DUF3787 domain-containing protein n=1 Tax=Paramaledivibacter caminithermalis (strain DSM 15212 / CIP 107654 / DViRD3) TaxID=1121301 RepID=A0A1M6P928_PARC5|nr:DUF3787 domain-containing protein [Paramaledivibacter caminithermalis]SHK04459.1 protein of unknown function [Paramaledivibacter caminithermalis DSM 15212]